MLSGNLMFLSIVPDGAVKAAIAGGVQIQRKIPIALKNMFMDENVVWEPAL